MKIRGSNVKKQNRSDATDLLEEAEGSQISRRIKFLLVVKFWWLEVNGKVEVKIYPQD